MIIRVLIAVVLAVPAYFYTMRYNMHMFQQNGYKNKEHIHWLKKDSLFWSGTGHCNLCVSVPCP